VDSIKFSCYGTVCIASDNGEGGPRERQGPKDFSQVRADVPAPGRRVRAEAGRQELHGPRRRRHHRRALGQLQVQAIKSERRAER